MKILELLNLRQRRKDIVIIFKYLKNCSFSQVRWSYTTFSIAWKLQLIFHSTSQSWVSSSFLWYALSQRPILHFSSCVMLPSSWPWMENIANHAPATHGICPDSLCPLTFYVTLCLKSFLTHFYRLNQFTDEESERRDRRISPRLPVKLVKEREQGLKNWMILNRNILYHVTSVMSSWRNWFATIVI